MTPNYELLKDAYAIIDGIPDEYFDLKYVVTNNDTKNIGCGTIACAAGWIGLHPDFHKKGFRISSHDGLGGYLTIKMRGVSTFEDSLFRKLAFLFGVSREDAVSLFTVRGHSVFDNDPLDVLSDKQLWKKRVELYLKKEEQL